MGEDDDVHPVLIVEAVKPLQKLNPVCDGDVVAAHVGLKSLVAPLIVEIAGADVLMAKPLESAKRVKNYRLVLAAR
jgi:hypothetical protein